MKETDSAGVFIVIVRFAASRVDAASASQSSSLIDLADTLGAIAGHAVEALTPEGHWFVFSHWAKRDGAGAYLGALAEQDSGLVANDDWTELRSIDPSRFHALLTERRST